MGVLLNYPLFHADDGNNAPLIGGKLYTYVAGTSTAKATYTTKAMSTANANPVVLDTRGDAIVYGAGLYKLILKNSADVTIWTQDNVPLADSSGGLSYYPDASETDHGTTGGGASLYDILDALGTTKKATVWFIHNGTGNTTSYAFSTTFDASTYTNVNFVIEKGAILNIGLTAAGPAAVLTLPSPNNVIVQPGQDYKSGDGTLAFSNTFSTAAARTISHTNLLIPVWLRDPNGAARTDTTDTAANIISNILKYDGATHTVTYINTGEAAETITIAGGTSVTVYNNEGAGDAVIPAGAGATLYFVRTSSTAVKLFVTVFEAV